jgi:hypothetical protein
VSLEAQGRGEDAAFYRGIARKLAEAHGRTRDAGRLSREAPGPVDDILPGGAY